MSQHAFVAEICVQPHRLTALSSFYSSSCCFKGGSDRQTDRPERMRGHRGGGGGGACCSAANKTESFYEGRESKKDGWRIATRRATQMRALVPLKSPRSAASRGGREDRSAARKRSPLPGVTATEEPLDWAQLARRFELFTDRHWQVAVYFQHVSTETSWTNKKSHKKRIKLFLCSENNFFFHVLVIGDFMLG